MKKRSWSFAHLFLPPVVTGALAAGALLGFTASPVDPARPGPGGEAAGAAGALLLIICIVVGYLVSSILLLVAKLRGRGPPGRIGLRLLLCGIAGAVVGRLAIDAGAAATGAAWLVLAVAPALASWSWR